MSSCTPGLSCLTFQTKEISEQECSLNFVTSKQGGNFFQTKEILEQECSLNFVTSKQGGNFQTKETLKYNGTTKLPSVSLGMSSVCLRHQELH